MAAPFEEGARWRIALVVHPTRTNAHELAKRARSWWESRGHYVVEDDSVGGPDPSLLDGDLDLVISFGGDGTMLRTLQLVRAHQVAVLGVNLGALGYLTQVEPAGLEAAFERLVRGDYAIEERMSLDVLLEAVGGGETHFSGFNDAVIEKTAQGHTIRLALSIGAEDFLTYVADGFLISTPTGSTAYNLSLRGPIVSPRLSALILTPISPHMLFDRSLVVDGSESVQLEVIGDRAGVLIVDGLGEHPIQPGDRLTARAGAAPARVVSFDRRKVYGVLRSKFGLADR